jgi:signal transduction histidine kinase
MDEREGERILGFMCRLLVNGFSGTNSLAEKLTLAGYTQRYCHQAPVVKLVQQSAAAFSTPFDASDLRMLAGARLVLAVTALLVNWIDPSGPVQLAGATYLVLAIYLCFSTVVYLLALPDTQLSVLFQRSLHWVDIGFFVTLIGLSGGTNSIYFVLLFFCIIEASFRWGFGAGLASTVVSTILFGVVGYASSALNIDFDLNRFLLRFSALFVLGYLIARRGGYEVRLKRRLSLLKEISALSDPRFGIDRTLGVNMERLRAFFRADACVVVLADADDGVFFVRRALPRDPDAAMRPAPVSNSWAQTLLSCGGEDAVYFRRDASDWPRYRPSLMSAGTPKAPRRPTDEASWSAVAEMLDTAAFLSVPLRSCRLQGRLFLLASSPAFGATDGDFLRQAVDHFMPVLDHVLLMDRMATRAGEDERQRIALDIHDRVIQPYVGLRLGLVSLRELLNAAPADQAVQLLTVRTERLIALSDTAIVDLRQYVQALRQGQTAGVGLTEGLRRYVDRLHEATGVRISLTIAEDLSLNDGLAADVFSMVIEGISNIRRHTHAAQCKVELARRGDRLILSITNPTDPGSPPATFVPGSIHERAAGWQGQCRVTVEEDGETAVVVDIPL